MLRAERLRKRNATIQRRKQDERRIPKRLPPRLCRLPVFPPDSERVREEKLHVMHFLKMLICTSNEEEYN